MGMKEAVRALRILETEYAGRNIEITTHYIKNQCEYMMQADMGIKTSAVRGWLNTAHKKGLIEKKKGLVGSLMDCSWKTLHKTQPAPGKPAQKGPLDIVIGKLADLRFSSDAGDFHIFRARANGGKWFSAIYKGENPPKARKSVEVVMFGRWSNHPKFGKQLEIDRVERYSGMSQAEESEATVRRHVARIVGDDRPSNEWIAEKAREKAESHRARYPGFENAERYVAWVKSLPLRNQLAELQQDDSVKEWNKGRRKGDAISRMAAAEA